MNSISSNLNIMIKAAEKASKIIIRDFACGFSQHSCVEVLNAKIGRIVRHSTSYTVRPSTLSYVVVTRIASSYVVVRHSAS